MWSRKDLRRWPGFDPITFTFSENSNYWRESLLEIRRQNIAGWCQQTFWKQKVCWKSNVLPLLFKQTFPAIIWIFTVCKGDEIESRLPFKIFSTLPKNWKVNCIQFTYLLVTFLLISFLAAIWNQYAISITHVKNKIWLVPHSHVCYITFSSYIQIPFNYLEFD